MKYYTEVYSTKKGYGFGFEKINAIDAEEALKIGLEQFKTLCHADQKGNIIYVYESAGDNAEDAEVIGEFKLDHNS